MKTWGNRQRSGQRAGQEEARLERREWIEMKEIAFRIVIWRKLLNEKEEISIKTKISEIERKCKK
jgi:hypothetical protein